MRRANIDPPTLLSLGLPEDEMMGLDSQVESALDEIMHSERGSDQEDESCDPMDESQDEENFSVLAKAAEDKPVDEDMNLPMDNDPMVLDVIGLNCHGLDRPNEMPSRRNKPVVMRGGATTSYCL